MTKTQARKETVAQMRDDFNKIVDMVFDAPAGEVIAEVEGEARKRALSLYRGIVESAVTMRGKEEKRKAAPACQCGNKMRMAYRSPKHVLTLLGQMTFTRRYYYCSTCKTSFVPFDEEMGLEEFSDGVQRGAVLCGSTKSFDAAVHQLKELGEIHISKETVRRLTEKAASTLQDIQESGSLLGEESACRFDGEDRSYVCMDGTMVNTLEDNWREVKVGAFYDQEKAKKHYVATLLDSHEFGQIMRRQGGNLALGCAREIIAGGDGAPWIWKQMEVNFPMADHQFLDYYHLSEKIYACAWELYGPESPKGNRWATDKLHRVRHEGGEALLDTLKHARRRRKKARSKQALTTLIKYLHSHRTRTRYPHLKAMGIDIGTGPQESACKNVIGQRLKGRGMRWSLPNAEAMARLRAYASDISNWAKKWKTLKRAGQTCQQAA